MTVRLWLPAVAAVALLASAAGGTAEARITELRVDATEPFADGAEFAPTGAYVRIKGVAKGELDPTDPRNAVIVDLDRAPRNDRGMVEYGVDFFILRPADAARGNRTILYDVTNRGRKFLLHWLNDAPATSPAAINDPKTLGDAGNGFVLREGYTIVWSGWDPYAPTANDGMTIRVPVATGEGGEPIVETIRDEFVFGSRGLNDRTQARLSYEAASPDTATARLTVRDRQDDPREEIPDDRWTFADSKTIRLLPEGTEFEPGRIYEVWYEAKDPRVLGIGYAATRDLVAFLRNETEDDAGNTNPVALPAAAGDGTGIEAALAIGISQSGRYLRHYIELGMNQDEAGRKVFDGVLPHISGAGKVFANHRFGQAFRTATFHEDHAFPENWFPFAYAEVEDPLTGKTEGLLRGDGFDPLVIETNTSTEYWQKGASLLHTDSTGSRDLELPATVRHYLIAGTQHGGRIGLDTKPGPCVNPRSPHNPSPALRALLTALDKWVTEGVEPPPSQIPTLADGTLVPVERAAFPSMPGAQVATHVNRVIVLGDWVDPPAEEGMDAYAALVPQVDEDGNEVAGVRLPGIAVPVGTYAGWNVYAPPFPEGELCDRDGSFIAFARTKAEREAAGDPRPSLEERYGDHAGYVERVGAAADELVRAGLLLPEDAARYVEDAKRNDPFAR